MERNKGQGSGSSLDAVGHHTRVSPLWCISLTAAWAQAQAMRAWMAPWLGGSRGGGGVVRGTGGTGEEPVEEMVFGLAVTTEGSEDRRQPREREAGGREGLVRKSRCTQRAWVGAGRVVVARGH